MKRYIKYSFTVFYLLFISCSDYNLSVKISGLKTDSLLVHVYDMNRQEHLYTDTIPFKNGSFSTRLTDTTVLGIGICPKNNKEKNNALLMSLKGPFYLLPGDCLKIRNKQGHIIASGTDLYDRLNSFRQLNASQIKRDRVYTELYQIDYQDEKNKHSFDSVSNLLDTLEMDIEKEKISIIKKYPDENIAAYILLTLEMESAVKHICDLDENIKNGPFKTALKDLNEKYEHKAAMEKAKENIQPGKPAPEFTLRDIKGKERSLTSFKGRYIVLDFWGTWCGWCIKGIPEMKKYYNRYRNKMEIIGIDCGDDEKEWKKGVEEHKLPWVNLYNGNDELLIKKYVIEGYPTKILIDKQGLIVDVFLGENEALYKQLDQLFK